MPPLLAALALAVSVLTAYCCMRVRAKKSTPPSSRVRVSLSRLNCYMNQAPGPTEWTIERGSSDRLTRGGPGSSDRPTRGGPTDEVAGEGADAGGTAEAECTTKEVADLAEPGSRGQRPGRARTMWHGQGALHHVRILDSTDEPQAGVGTEMAMKMGEHVAEQGGRWNDRWDYVRSGF